MPGTAQFNDLAPIRGTVKRLKSDGLPVSEYTLRSWVRTKQIPAAWCGNKALLYYPNVVNFLKAGFENVQ